MAAETAGFFNMSAAYEALGGTPIAVAARYATKDLLVSGWIEGESVIAGRSAVIQAKTGNGRVVVLGFPVQHRGQTYATFRLLFNAVLSTPTAASTKRKVPR